jgi:hypothetical protein
MSLAPLPSVPVSRVDSVLEVVSKGGGDQPADEVFITTTMTLTADIDSTREVTLILPMSSEASQQPLLRYVGGDIQTTSVTFDPVERSAYDERVAKALAALADGVTKREQKELERAIAKAAKSFSQAVLVVPPGQRQLRFFFTIAADRVGEREYEFQVLGPLASFALAAGGSISVVALLARNTTLVEAHGLQNPSDPGSEIGRQEADLGGRRVLGWIWQYDPIFRVRYRY